MIEPTTFAIGVGAGAIAAVTAPMVGFGGKLHHHRSLIR